MSDPRARQLRIWESYIARKRLLDERALAISERYSQWLLTIAGGALGLSLTFLEKMAPNPASDTLWLAIVSWTLLVASLLGAFLAIYCSQQAIRRQLQIAEHKQAVYSKSQNTQLPDVPPDDCRNKYSELIPTIDKCSVIALILGITSLCFFSFLNLRKAEAAASPSEPESVELTIDFGDKRQKVKISIGKGKKDMSDDKENQQQRQLESDKSELMRKSYVPTQEDQPPPEESSETQNEN